MMEKIFDKIPYGALANVKFAHFMAGAGGLIMVVVGAYYFLLAGPMHEEYEALEAEQVKVENTLVKYELEVSQKDLVTKQVATLAGTLVEKKRQLPLHRELPALLSKISDVAEFLDLSVQSFEMKPSETKDFYKVIPVSLTISGDYYRTAGFFDTLQSLLRLVNISELSMEVKSEQAVGVDEESGEAVMESVKKLTTTIEARTFAYIEGSEDK